MDISQSIRAAEARAGALQAAEPQILVAFWRDVGARGWFAQEPELDRRFRDGYLHTHELAARGQLERWRRSAEGSLALVLLLDQFPRHAFRGTARMYATDELARAAADSALAEGHDARFEPGLRLFFYLPFAHSETLADQDRSVALSAGLGEHDRRKAEHHRDIVRRFGRFPHRNAILGRTPRLEELRYLAEGGFAG